MPPSPPQLLVVLPVFNEEASIRTVVNPWFMALCDLTIDFVILAIDDGSTDGTPGHLDELCAELGSRFEWRSRPNRGHGQTCVEGYREAIAREIPHVLQIDSDGQCDPVFFADFWKLRDDYDVIYGQRTRRDGVRRVIASAILKRSLRLGFGVDCIDANVPYRLMNTSTCRHAIQEIPPEFHLANIALAVGLRRCPAIRHGLVPIIFRERIGGEPSVPFWKFAIRAFELFKQLRELDQSKHTNR